MLTMQCTGAGDRSVFTWTITRASPVIAVVLLQRIGAKVTPAVPTFRVVRLIAVLSLLTAGLLLCLFIFNATIQPPPSDGPIEEWIQAGIDLHRVDELDSMNVFSRSEYETEYARALQAAQQIARHSEFPGTNESYTEYNELRVIDLQWSPVFWVAMASCFAISLSAFSWLNGASWSCATRTEKAAEQNAEPELPITGF